METTTFSEFPTPDGPVSPCTKTIASLHIMGDSPRKGPSTFERHQVIFELPIPSLGSLALGAGQHLHIFEQAIPKPKMENVS